MFDILGKWFENIANIKSIQWKWWDCYYTVNLINWKADTLCQLFFCLLASMLTTHFVRWIEKHWKMVDNMFLLLLCESKCMRALMWAHLDKGIQRVSFVCVCVRFWLKLSKHFKMRWRNEYKAREKHTFEMCMDSKEASEWETVKKLNWIDLNGTEIYIFLEKYSTQPDCIVCACVRFSTFFP